MSKDVHFKHSLFLEGSPYDKLIKGQNPNHQLCAVGNMAANVRFTCSAITGEALHTVYQYQWANGVKWGPPGGSDSLCSKLCYLMIMKQGLSPSVNSDFTN